MCSRLRKVAVTRTQQALAVRMMLSLVSASGSMFVVAAPLAAQQRPGLASEITEFKGTVVAAREAEISPRFDGLLRRIRFSPGQVVEEGDLLFEFEPAGKQLILAADRAKRKRAEAQLRGAEIKLKNNEPLRGKNVISEMAFLELEVARDIAAANAEEARAHERGAEIGLKEMNLYAPFKGVMSHPFVKEGVFITQHARDQSALAQITQLNPILVRGQVPYEMYHRRRESLKTDAPERMEFSLILPNGEEFPQVSRYVGGGYEFEAETQTIVVWFEFPNPDYLLRPGLRVTVQSKIKSN
jgi:RND family efflux transporter MFP subunit